MKPDEFWALTWGEYKRMQKGYYKRQNIDYKTANVLAAIYNTIPQKKGATPAKAKDFMLNESNDKIEHNLSEDEIKEKQDKAIKNAERFNKGVVYEDYNG